MLEASQELVQQPRQPGEAWNSPLKPNQHFTRHPSGVGSFSHYFQLGDRSTSFYTQTKKCRCKYQRPPPWSFRQCRYDIRTSATNLEDVSEQVSNVDTFTQSRGLKLCPEKCTLLPSGHTSTHHLSITVAGSCLAVEPWWSVLVCGGIPHPPARHQ